MGQTRVNPSTCAISEPAAEPRTSTGILFCLAKLTISCTTRK